VSRHVLVAANCLLQILPSEPATAFSVHDSRDLRVRQHRFTLARRGNIIAPVYVHGEGQFAAGRSRLPRTDSLPRVKRASMDPAANVRA